MNKELEVNWITNHKKFGEIVIKTLDLNSYYLWTKNKNYPTFGVDSEVAKSCFPTIPMLMTKYIKQALTPPNAEQVCEALSEWFEEKVIYNEIENKFGYFDIDNDFYELVTMGLRNDVIFSITDDFPPRIITMIGKFYEGIE